jgi:hypothetical protein
MRIITLAVALLLAGCARPKLVSPPPPSATAPIDVAAMMFATPGRDLGLARIFDSIMPILIARVAYAPGGTIETHSTFLKLEGCIAALAEETWDRPPTRMKWKQTYNRGLGICYFPLVIAAGETLRTETGETRWDWERFDRIAGGGHGWFQAWTVLQASPDGRRLDLEEFFEYLDPLPDERPFHRRYRFDATGMISLEKVR